MLEVIKANQNLFWVLGVFIAAFILRFVIIKGLDFLIKQNKRDKNTDSGSTIQMLKKIVSIFIFLIGSFLASYAFFEKEFYETINENFIRIIWIGIVAIATIIAVAINHRYFINKIASTSMRDKGDPTAYKFLNYFCTFFIYFIGFTLAALAIPPLRSLAQSALAGAGVLAVVGGVASQEAISNIVGGIFIVFSKPFRIGDVIRVGSDVVGQVEDLTLRHTVIKDFHNKRVVIPNAIINKEQITNYNFGDQNICEWIIIGISYDSVIQKAMDIMESEALDHPNCIDHRSSYQKKNGEPQVLVKVTDLGDSSVNIRAWVWARNYAMAVEMRHDLYKSIKLRFDEEGIEIPFPHRTVIHKNAFIPSEAKDPTSDIMLAKAG